MLQCEKFERLMKLAYSDDMPPSHQNKDDGENVVHEEGLNEILIGFFGDGSNYEGDARMVVNNDDIEGNYHQCNVDDINLNDSIKQAMKTVVFKSGARRTSKFSCILILLEIKSLFGWLDNSFTTLLK